MLDIHERLDKILPRIKEKSFMEGQGLGNEIGYYVFDYDAQHELLVREHIEFVKDKINNGKFSFKIVEFDLYNIILEILDEKGYLEKTIRMEKRFDKERVLEGTKKSLRILDDKKNLVVDYITDRVEEDNIVFLTGVGKAWPILRSHTVLNNLHAALDKVPVVMFFPGIYDGAVLRLFNEIKDDNYYRAFRLV